MTLADHALNRWIIDSATDFAVIATDCHGDVTAWNEGARLVLGWTEGEMLGQPLDCIFMPEDIAADHPATEMRRVLETGAGNDDRWHLRKTGERFWGNGQTTVLRDSEGVAIGFVKVLRDRTEQQLSTETLSGSPANISLLLDSMIEGLYAVDTQGVTTLCNAAFQRMMGFQRAEDAIGRKLHDVIHSHHPDGSAYDVADCPIYRCAREGTPAHVRGELFFPVDGAPPMPVEYRATPIISVGELQGAICTFVAVSDERDASERLELALNAGAIVGTWVWDVSSDIFIADDRFAQSFGLSPELCRTGLPLDQVLASIHEADRAGVAVAIADTLARGGLYRREYRVLQYDGVFRWVEANGRVEFDPDGAPLRFPGVLLDIEARRTAEAERDRISTLLQSFTAAVPGVVYAKDRDGRFLVANRGTTELIGKPPEQYIGRTDADVLGDGGQAAEIMATDRRIMETGQEEQIEEDVRLPDGTPATWLSTKAPLFSETGEVIGLVGSSVDVTARKQAEAEIRDLNRTLEQRVDEAIAERELIEEALRQSQKMEAVGQLTGGLAHDFNNLLTGMMGNLELLQNRVARGQMVDLDRFILAAQGAGRRAASLTQRLLAFRDVKRLTLSPQTSIGSSLAWRTCCGVRSGLLIRLRWSARRVCGRPTSMAASSRMRSSTFASTRATRCPMAVG